MREYIITLGPPIMAWTIESFRFIPPDRSLLAKLLLLTKLISVSISVI